MINNFKLFFAFIFFLFSFSTMGQDEFQDSILKLLEQPIEDTLRVHLNNELAWYYKSDNPTLALSYANEALDLATESNDQKGIANAIHGIGMINWYRGNYELSLTFFFRALKIREELKDSIGLARSYNNIGHFYFRQKDHEEAIKFYTNSLKIREVLKDSIGIVYSLNSVAEVYSNQNKPEALVYLLKAADIAESLRDQRGKEFTYSKLGEYFMTIKNLNKALFYFNKALKINQQEGNDYSLSQNLNNLASVYFQQNLPEEAINYATQSLELAAQLNALELKGVSSTLLAQAYASLGDYQNAYRYEVQSDSYEKALFNAASEKAISEIQEKYEYEKQRAGLLDKVLKEQQKVNRLRTSLYMLILAFLIVLAFLYGWRYRSQMKVNQLLQQQQKEIEQTNENLRHSNAALEQFAYIASHDLKEPLRTIGNYTTLLVRRTNTADDPEIAEFVQFIVGGVKQMYRLLEDLLAYSKITKGSQRPKEAINLNTLVPSVVQSLDHLIKDAEASIFIGPLPSIEGIHSQMAQLFQNLITNGLKFNKSKKPVIEISCTQESGQNHFKIKDNGIGIEPAFQAKIFQIFKRLHQLEYPGTGIGLAICEKIVQQHNGKIWVESEVEQGSTFHFTLPENGSKYPV